MRLSRTNCRLWIFALAVCALLASGCAGWRWPRIDPSGQHFFLPQPTYVEEPAAEPYVVPQEGVLQPGPAPSQPYAPATVLPGSGVATASVTITPHRTAAPIGSEVILVASVCERGQAVPKRRLEWTIAQGGAGQFVAVGRNTLIDKLAGDFNNPRKVNNAYAIGSTSRSDFSLDRGTPDPGDDKPIRRGQGWVSLTSSIEGTSRVSVYAPELPAWEARNATAEIVWIDATWQFPAPAINPAGSSQVLTTTVTRSSDGAPCAGWIVRYVVEDGPAAGFLPERKASIEVTTDASGQATAEIAQTQPQRGTNRVAIEIIRPGQPGASPEQGGAPQQAGTGAGRVVVERGTVLLTWTAADLAVRKQAPAQAGLGGPLTYRIEVSNPGDVVVDEVAVTDVLPEGLAYLDSNPAAQASGNTLTWSLGQVAPASSRTIEVRCRADRLGEVVNRVEVAAAGGLSANHQATTQVTAAEVEIRMNQPSQVTVGGRAQFLIQITNRGRVSTGKLRIKDTLGAGLDHPVAVRGAIERDVDSLQPGETQQIDVAFTTTQAGRLCHTVEVFGPEGLRARSEGCVQVVAAATPRAASPPVEPMPRPTPEPSLPPLDTPPGPAKTEPAPREPAPAPVQAAQPSPTPSQPLPPGKVSVRITGPKEVAEGEVARFFIDLTNTGQRDLTNLEVVNRFDSELSASAASDKYRLAGNTLSWTIDRLPVGETVPLELHCETRRAAEAAYNEVTVSSAEGAVARGRACLKILPVQSELSIAVADLRDPVAMKKGLTYEIRVTNRAATAARNVTLVATVPEGMLPDPIGTSGPPEVEYFINEQSVEFQALAEIPAGKTVTYRVRVRTVAAGKQTFRVELTAPGLAQPVREEEVTEVFE